jgi:thiol:disulfide interchange protein DsbD
MKFTFFSAVLLVAVVFVGCNESQGKSAVENTVQPAAVKTSAEGITWVYNMDEGLKLATAQKKPVMVDFYAEWCGWCKKLDKDVYTDSQVKLLSKNFICIKIDTDKNQASASKYDVQGLPTIVFLKGDGTVINKIVGYQPAPEFAKSMQAALQK